MSTTLIRSGSGSESGATAALPTARAIAYFLGMGAACFLGACDQRSPTELVERQPRPLVHEVSAPVLLNEMDFGAPPLSWNEDGSLGGSVALTDIPQTIYGPRWVRVRVTGTIKVSINPPSLAWVCNDFPVGCYPIEAWNLNGRAIGPMGNYVPWEGWDLRVGVYENYVDLPLHTAENDTVAEALYWVPNRANRFQIARSGALRGAVYFNVPKYAFEGQQHVTFEEIPQPLQITSEPLGDGSLRFSATATEPYILFSETSWHFVEGDTASAPNYYWDGFLSGRAAPAIASCAGKSTCDFKPPAPGRMYLGGRLLSSDMTTITRHAFFFSQVTGPKKQNPKLILTCSQLTVTRDQGIDCTAHVDPAVLQDSLKGIHWTFDGRPRTDGDVSARSWGGTMVVGGTIIVTGTVQGTAVADSAKIVVRSRTWPRMRAISPAHDSLHGDLPATPTPLPPTAVQPFGYVLGTLAHSQMQRVNMPYVGRSDSVLSGPNTGWHYVKTPLPGPYWSVDISNAFDHSNAWYQSQHYGSPGGPANLPYCTRAEIDTLRMRAELHEGLRQSPLSSTDLFQPTNNHFRFFRDWISANDPNNRVYEGLLWNADTVQVRGGPTPDQYMETIWNERVDAPHHVENALAVDSVQVNRVPLTCRAR